MAQGLRSEDRDSRVLLNGDLKLETGTQESRIRKDLSNPAAGYDE
jgi:hypothetical protein